MRIIITLCLLTIPFFSFSQTFYIEPTGENFESPIKRKIEDEGYKVVSSKDEADYAITLYWKKVKSINMNTHEGHISIFEPKSWALVAKSEPVKKYPNVRNGYKAVPNIMEVIADKQLPEMLKGLSKLK